MQKGTPNSIALTLFAEKKCRKIAALRIEAATCPDMEPILRMVLTLLLTFSVDRKICGGPVSFMQQRISAESPDYPVQAKNIAAEIAGK